MARKTKGKTAATSEEDDSMVLTGVLFWKFRAVESDFARVQMELDLKSAELGQLMAKYDDVRACFGARQALLNELSTKKADVIAVQQEIQAHLGVDLRNCSFDDKTGRIHVILPSGSSKAAKSK